MNTTAHRNKDKFSVNTQVYSRTLGYGKIIGTSWAEGNYYWVVEFKDENGKKFSINLSESNLFPCKWF